MYRGQVYSKVYPKGYPMTNGPIVSVELPDDIKELIVAGIMLDHEVGEMLKTPDFRDETEANVKAARARFATAYAAFKAEKPPC